MDRHEVTFQRSSFALSDLLHLPDVLSFIPPILLARLRERTSDPHQIAIEAHLAGELVGLSFAEVYPLHHLAQIDALIVKPTHRNRGIGRALFVFTEDILVQEEGACALEFLYEGRDSSTPALEKILIASGWLPGKWFLLRCHFDLSTFNPEWLYYPPRLSTGIEIFPWERLSTEDRSTIVHLEEQGRFLPYLSPLQSEESIDIDISVGLRDQGRICGWNITQRDSPSTRRYASLYIDRRFLYTGYGIQLLAASLRLQKEKPLPCAIFEANANEIDPGWRRFIHKRLLPLATQIERIKRAYRTLALPIND